MHPKTDEVENVVEKLGLSEIKKPNEMNFIDSTLKIKLIIRLIHHLKVRIYIKKTNLKFLSSKKSVFDINLQKKTVKNDIKISTIRLNFLKKEKSQVLKNSKKICIIYRIINR